MNRILINSIEVSLYHHEDAHKDLVNMKADRKTLEVSESYISGIRKDLQDAQHGRNIQELTSKYLSPK